VTDQTQDTRHGAEPPRPPIPDLGFFAGSPTPSGGSPVFGGSSPGGAPSPFGTPAAAPFGTPAAAPVGAPAPWAGATGAPLQPTRSGLSTGWKAAAAAAAVVLLIGLVFGGRFGWQQFVADPVLPERLAGMPRVTGPAADQTSAQMADQVGEQLSPGSKTKVALYTYGRGIGYLVVAVRGGVKSGSGGSGEGDSEAGWTRTEVDGATCMSRSEPSAHGPVGTTFCTRGFWRRAVIVYAFATLLPDPVTVARATNEAWDAQ
jgi:hypothetical protein